MEELNPKNNEAWDDWDEWAFGEEVNFTVPEITHNIWPHINQWISKKTTSACTMAWTLCQIIRLFWIDLPLKESTSLLEEVVDYCVKEHWYVVWHWWSTPTAINAVCKWRNEVGAKRFNKEKVFYTRRDYQDSKVKETLSKWHLVGFTYALNWWDDKKKGLVWRDNYPWAWWHRTNWQSTKTTKPGWWASEPTADCWVYDNYYLSSSNQYLIRDRKKYMNRWMYTPAYLILPQSTMEKSVEEVKENIAETKAINYVLWSLTTARSSVPEKYQEKFAQLAKEIREDYKDARKLENEAHKKWAEAAVDWLSYLWKFMDEDSQKEFATLATKLREKYNFK